MRAIELRPIPYVIGTSILVPGLQSALGWMAAGVEPEQPFWREHYSTKATSPPPSSSVPLAIVIAA